MATIINGTTGIDKIQDGTVVDADIASLAASKLTGDLPAGMGGKVLQVVSVTKSDTFSLASSTFTDITGLAATITPSSTTSKILVSISVTGYSANDAAIRLLRGATVIGAGDAAGSRILGIVEFPQSYRIHETDTVSMQYLDSPATTSATTYKLQCRQNSGDPIYVNRSQSDSDNTGDSRLISNITLMEIGV